MVANLESEAASGRDELATVRADLEALDPQLADDRRTIGADAGGSMFTAAGGDAAEVRGELRSAAAPSGPRPS